MNTYLYKNELEHMPVAQYHTLQINMNRIFIFYILADTNSNNSDSSVAVPTRLAICV
jgi:hypothetical protein